ncbi:transcription cofactor vestigial-like protein 1 [Peromyscus leucopus]|uniref:transcription cofactor vestigial-like protein 1 n=1 Tax=Peromyscus leucopus TaxID=10041 RepID=UPI0018850BA8|nr:transcription cofactor vestigial-like protein 1 [Peromyscus leucopus]
MEDMRKTGVRIPQSSQKPVKTEWDARSVVFTYFQGDISSVVDEHFSRALSKLKRPQGWSSLSQGDNVILRNDSSMPPNQWRLTSSWTKARPEASLGNGASSSSSSSRSSSSSSSSLHEYGPKAIDQYPLSMPKAPSAHPQEMCHFSSQERPDFLGPAYSRAFPDRHPAPEVYPDGRRGSFLHLLQQDRYLNRPLEPATRKNGNPAKIAGSTGLLTNLPPNSDHYKKIYGHGSASSSLGNERSRSPERRRDFYFY